MPTVDLDGTASWAFTTPDASLNRLMNISGTAAWVFTTPAASLNRLMNISGTAAWTFTVANAALQLIVTFAGSAAWTFRALATLFYPTAIAAVPATVNAKALSQLTISMPTPTLDSKGRPTQPWTPT